MTKENYLKLKEEVKKFAVEIKEDKKNLKNFQRENPNKYCGGMMENLRVKRRDARHYNIVYGLVRGRKYEQIEPKVREGNEPSWYKIEKIKDQFGFGEEGERNVS